MRTLIVTGGIINDSFFKKVLMNHNFDTIIGVDGGLECLYRHTIIPQVVLGDFDTIDKDILNYYKNQEEILIKEYQPEKDATDTEIAIEYAVSIGSSEITILGATGTRLDHTFGNLHSLLIAKKKGIPCCILDEHNHIELIDSGTKLEKKQQFGHYISFIPLTTTVEHITLKGFRYPLNDATLTIGNCNGVSNEIKEDCAEVLFDEGILIMIQSKD